MDRLFLDANVLFSAAYDSKARVLQIWKLKNVVLCTSHYALAEADVNLDDEARRARLADLAKQLEFFEAPQREPPKRILLREKDLPILLAAIEAHATHLLTGDLRDFGPHFGKRIEGVLVMRPGEYLRLRGII